MKILVIGGTGLIGRKITERALAEGHDCAVLSRGISGLELVPAARRIVGERTDYARLREIFRTEIFDVVVDQRCYDAEQARGLWEAAAGRIGQLIFTSTCCVYSKPIAALPIREDETAADPDPSFRYGYEKRRAELFLLKAAAGGGPKLTIIRPSLTVGEGAMIMGFFAGDYTLIHRLRAGLPLICPGGGQSLWTVTYTGDIATGYIGACGNPQTYGRIYHLTTNTAMTWENLFRIMAKIAGASPPDLVYIPAQTLFRIKPCWQTEMLYWDKQHTAVFDNTKAKRDIPAFRADTPFAETFRKALAWYDEDPARQTIDPEAMALEDQLIEVYRRKEGEMGDIIL